VTDSFLVQGVAFKKTFSYAGFEQQPKSFVDPKILLLNVELELKSEKENAGTFSLPTLYYYLYQSHLLQLAVVRLLQVVKYTL
jgi:hypothetical protein